MQVDARESAAELVATLTKVLHPVGQELESLISSRVATLPDDQLAALEVIIRPWARAHELIIRLRRVPAADVRLTPRESEVLRLLCDGLSAAGIAGRLGVSPRTVTKHQERLYRKLGTCDRLSTVLHAQRLGLVSLAP